MIAPTRNLCVLAAAPAVLTLLLYAYPEGWPAFVVANSGLIVIALFDLLSLPRRRGFKARREMGHVATRGEKHPITVAIENRSKRVQRLRSR